MWSVYTGKGEYWRKSGPVDPFFFAPTLKGLEQIRRSHSSENCYLHCSAELELILRLSTKIFNKRLMRLMANLSWMMCGEKQEMLRVINLNFRGDRSKIFPKISLMKLKHSWRNRKISKSDGRSDCFFMMSCFNSQFCKSQLNSFARRNSSWFSRSISFNWLPDRNYRPYRAPKTYQWDVWDRHKYKTSKSRPF